MSISPGHFAGEHEPHADQHGRFAAPDRHSEQPLRSANLGVQTKVSSHLFLNASLLDIWQAYDLNQAVYPDSFGSMQCSLQIRFCL